MERTSRNGVVLCPRTASPSHIASSWDTPIRKYQNLMSSTKPDNFFSTFPSQIVNFTPSSSATLSNQFPSSKGALRAFKHDLAHLFNTGSSPTFTSHCFQSLPPLPNIGNCDFKQLPLTTDSTNTWPNRSGNKQSAQRPNDTPAR